MVWLPFKLFDRLRCGLLIFYSSIDLQIYTLIADQSTVVLILRGFSIFYSGCDIVFFLHLSFFGVEMSLLSWWNHFRWCQFCQWCAFAFAIKILSITFDYRVLPRSHSLLWLMNIFLNLNPLPDFQYRYC